MQLLKTLCLLSMTVMLLIRAQMAYGQVPAAPPPTREQEGTERCWDISHPGWRTWNKESQQKPAGTKPAANQPQSSQLPPPNPLEEQKKRQEQQRKAQLEQFWQQVQAQQTQQQLQEAERQKAFNQGKQTLLANFRIPAGTVETGPRGPLAQRDPTDPPYRSVYAPTAFGLAPAVSDSRTGGLSPPQWHQARQYQGLIDTLQRSPETTAQDKAILEMAEVRRAALWKQAVCLPGLPDDAREALALRLPVAEPKAPVPRLTKQDIEQIESPTRSPNDQSSASAPTLPDWVQGLAGEGITDSLFAEETAQRFGDFFGIATIAVTTAQDGTSSGIAKTLDFVVGKIPFPQATAALEGGRLYSNVAFQATNQFMTDAMTAAGGTFDPSAFWGDFKNDLNVWQKAVMEFVDYGPKN